MGLRAEKTIRDRQRGRSQKERLEELMDLQDDREDDYTLNCKLRKSNRERRKIEQAEEEAARRRPKPNFAMTLEPHNDADLAEAKSIAFKTDHDKIAVAVRRTAAASAPILKRSNSDRDDSAISELIAKRRKLAMHARMESLFRKK